MPLADYLNTKLLDNLGTAYITAGLAFCAYLAVVPPQIRDRVSRDSSRFWRLTAVGAVVTVGLYEMVVADKLLDQVEASEAQIRRLKKQRTALSTAIGSDVSGTE